MVSDPVPAARLDHRVSPANVRIEKSCRRGDRVVVMRLRGEVHHRVCPRNQPIDHRFIAYVANYQTYAIRRQAGDIRRIPRIGEFIEHRYQNTGLLADNISHEIRSHEATAARDKDAAWSTYILAHSATPNPGFNICSNASDQITAF